MKTLKNIFSVALLATALVACEDVPMPYEINMGEDEPETSVYYSSTALNNGWKLQAEGVEQLQPWSQGSSYTQATGYQDWEGTGTKSNKEVTGWLISPAFHTVAETGKVKFYFDYTLRYTNNVSGYANNHKVYVTDNYTGDATTTTWTELSWKPSPSAYSDWTTYGSGDIQLPSEFVNKEGVHIAFWFHAPANASTTWELLNFYLEEGVAGEQGGNEGGDTPDTSVNGVPYTSASLQEGWKTWAASGKNNPWSQGSSYTQATGYQKWSGDSKSNREVDGYLISPAFNTTVASGKVKMSFDNCVGYAANDPDYAKHVKLYISKTADGTNFNAAEWEQLDWTATHESTNWTLSTDEVQLPEAYVNQENVHVAFWFYAPADKSSTFELKTFKLLEGEAGQPAPDGGEGGDAHDTGDADLVIQASALGLANATEVNGVNYQGFSFTADGGGNQNTPKYYTSGSAIRMYPKNSLTLTTDKTVDKVVLTCVGGSVANGNVGSTPGTVEVKDPTVTISGINAKSFTITDNDGSTGSASQIRIVSIAVYYAK
ncbi:MAG: hypothetical protein MJZ40_02605 [Bacteroidaceae bacterium]|nr:hypothetical protein [Bacteroidaceae bacterium]